MFQEIAEAQELKEKLFFRYNYYFIMPFKNKNLLQFQTR